MYDIKNPALKEVYEKQKEDTHNIRKMAEDVSLLRSLLQNAVNSCDDPVKQLKVAEAALATLVRLEAKLQEIDVQRNTLLEKSTVLALGDAIVDILTEAMRTYIADDEVRYAVTDYAAPRIASAIVDARNDE